MYSDVRSLHSVYMLKNEFAKVMKCVLIDQSNGSPPGIVVVKDPIIILVQCCVII